MYFSWHLAVIIVGVLIGFYLFQKGQTTANMTLEEQQNAAMYRTFAFVLWGIAIAVALYYYYINRDKQKASMCGAKAYMHGNKAHMCGAKAMMHGNKAHMCGGGRYY